ncbi:MAG: hypothetical protein DRI30_08040 [Chloroflexi bacterium]|nr:MAG: hypothetical protein DRI30_08040 [Chloroflexota bacterium]
MVLPAWTLVDPPEAVIGDEPEGPAHQLTQVVGAVRLSDGRIVVGDRVTKEARYFDSLGQHLRTVGGGGEGPGEMRILYAVDLIEGDTLVLGGWPIGSRYWFDTDGEFVESEILGPWFPGLLGRTLPDGSLLLDTYPQGSHGNTIEVWAAQGQEDRFRPTGVVELVSRDESQVDTLGPMYGEEWLKIGQLRQRFAMHALPFQWRTQVAWSRDAVFVGEMNRPEVRRYDRNGALLQIVRWVPSEVPVTSSDRGAFRESLLEGRRPDRRPDFERWLSQVQFPETKPVFQAIMADSEGILWVKDQRPVGSEMERWTVYGLDGVAVATLDMPLGLRVVDVNQNHVLAVWTDELDLEYLRSYRVER